MTGVQTCALPISQVLHPLLEDGHEGDQTYDASMKCAFLGISNWALDPAKMNRGIFVRRDVPNTQDLEDIARYEIGRASCRERV